MLFICFWILVASVYSLYWFIAFSEEGMWCSLCHCALYNLHKDVTVLWRSSMAWWSTKPITKRVRGYALQTGDKYYDDTKRQHHTSSTYSLCIIYSLICMHLLIIMTCMSNSYDMYMSKFNSVTGPGWSSPEKLWLARCRRAFLLLWVDNLLLFYSSCLFAPHPLRKDDKTTVDPPLFYTTTLYWLKNCTQHINRIRATVPLTGQAFGVIFLGGHISLKNRS
jgi:hypothetical protein